MIYPYRVYITHPLLYFKYLMDCYLICIGYEKHEIIIDWLKNGSSQSFWHQSLPQLPLFLP